MGIIILILIPSILLSQDPLESGCTDVSACNYNPDATEEDGSCEFVYDCLGICGGSAIQDDCGTCDGGSVCDGEMNQGQCTNGNFNVGEFNINGFDCAGWCLGTFSYGSDECYDCAGTPNSDAAPAGLDDCGICSGGDSGHIPNSDQDCNGECFGNAVLDECGVCNGDGNLCVSGCTVTDASNYYCNLYPEWCVEDVPQGDFVPDDDSCTYDVQGIVKYFDSEATPIQDVIITIYGSAGGLNYFIDSDSTDSDGVFIIPNVPLIITDGVNIILYEYYYLEYSYYEDTFLGIDYPDADLIAKFVVALEFFPYDNQNTEVYHSSIAADVDGNDNINAFDATLIRRFLSGASSSLNELDIRWKFVSQMDTIYDITNLTGNNELSIIGIKLGDPNGNWVRD